MSYLVLKGVWVYLLNQYYLMYLGLCDPQMSMTGLLGCVPLVGGSEHLSFVTRDRLKAVGIKCICVSVYACLCPGSLGRPEENDPTVFSVAHPPVCRPLLAYERVFLLWVLGGEQLPFLL